MEKKIYIILLFLLDEIYNLREELTGDVDIKKHELLRDKIEELLT